MPSAGALGKTALYRVALLDGEKVRRLDRAGGALRTELVLPGAQWWVVAGPAGFTHALRLLSPLPALALYARPGWR